MSEDQKMVGGTPIVNTDQVIEFLEARASKICPVCGHDDWTVQSPFPDNPVLAVGAPVVEVIKGKVGVAGIPMAIAVCKKCAFIRFHGLIEISRWIEAGKPEFSKNG